jgi:hypothetical protein
MSSPRWHRLVVGLGAGVLFAWSRPARADEMVIKFPGLHPNYTFEAEPHVLVAPFAGFLPGLGFRGTVGILQNGFVTSINNSIGVTFGLDWVDKGVWLPVAMQWNFWLSRNWSVFGEPGVAIRVGQGLASKRDDGLGWLGLWVGGRYHFTDRFTLTLRIGRPTLSVGVSFLL